MSFLNNLASISLTQLSFELFLCSVIATLIRFNLIRFSAKLFSLVFTCIIKILLTKKRYPAQFIIRYAVCHPACVMIYPARLVTRLELKCNSFCTPARAAIINHSKSVSIIRSDFQLLEMNSTHSKTAFTQYIFRSPQVEWTYVAIKFELSHELPNDFKTSL